MLNDGRNLKRFDAWWSGESEELPLMYVAARKDLSVSYPRPETPEAFYTDVDYLIARFEAEMKDTVYLADAFPSFSADLGPGSLALYLGAEPEFRWDTVWYKECIDDLETHPPLSFDPGNRWWIRHLDMMERAKRAAAGRYAVNIPDLIENLDILAAMRGVQNTLFDLMDEPERVKERIEEIDNSYFHYYDALHTLLGQPDGSCSYTAFHIRGTGRVAKIQCDFSAMLSPAQFREFVLPSLQKQVRRLNKSLYHLDGPDAIRHVPALMELEELNALQWTCGAGQPDGGSKRWYPIYDDVIRAKKSLWIQLSDGGVQGLIKSAEELMERYDARRLYFIFPDMREGDAEALMARAEKRWRIR